MVGGTPPTFENGGGQLKVVGGTPDQNMVFFFYASLWASFPNWPAAQIMHTGEKAKYTVQSTECQISLLVPGQ